MQDKPEILPLSRQDVQKVNALIDGKPIGVDGHKHSLRKFKRLALAARREALEPKRGSTASGGGGPARRPSEVKQQQQRRPSEVKQQQRRSPAERWHQAIHMVQEKGAKSKKKRPSMDHAAKSDPRSPKRAMSPKYRSDPGSPKPKHKPWSPRAGRRWRGMRVVVSDDSSSSEPETWCGPPVPRVPPRVPVPPLKLWVLGIGKSPSEAGLSEREAGLSESDVSESDVAPEPAKKAEEALEPLVSPIDGANTPEAPKAPSKAKGDDGGLQALISDFSFGSTMLASEGSSVLSGRKKGRHDALKRRIISKWVKQTAPKGPPAFPKPAPSSPKPAGSPVHPHGPARTPKRGAHARPPSPAGPAPDMCTGDMADAEAECAALALHDAVVRDTDYAALLAVGANGEQMLEVISRQAACWAEKVRRETRAAAPRKGPLSPPGLRVPRFGPPDPTPGTHMSTADPQVRGQHLQPAFVAHRRPLVQKFNTVGCLGGGWRRLEQAKGKGGRSPSVGAAPLDSTTPDEAEASQEEAWLRQHMRGTPLGGAKRYPIGTPGQTDAASRAAAPGSSLAEGAAGPAVAAPTAAAEVAPAAVAPVKSAADVAPGSAGDVGGGRGRDKVQVLGVSSQAAQRVPLRRRRRWIYHRSSLELIAVPRVAGACPAG